MSSFDNKSLKNFTLKSTTTFEFSTCNYVQSSSYINSPSIHNGKTSDNFTNTIFESDLPSVDNDW